ncbi:unnamed protein product [Miscanthus lutarioriparius]|uniref:Uncharacterized protein n=1 Tax=Miscanthus lutarioriparius TaxID=422564 RepID=A0A811PLZ2_9POAL|nr:unnamed protein product [Miscanthus lutarioriparius]
MALGFTWAHVIGDIPSAAACFSKWAQLFSGQKAPASTLRDPLAMPPSAAPPASVAAPPPSVKATAAPVGDHWAVPTTPTADVAELGALLAGAHLEEASAVVAAEFAGAEGEDADVVVYGANLTFVDAEGLEVYAGLELAGRRPAHVEYAVDGVGDGGAAVVHRDAGGRGRTVAAVLRRGEADRLRSAIRDALRVAA